jgi:anthranilate/para-aminobenzoate synthase component I
MSFLQSRDLTGVDTARLANFICRDRGMLFERFDLHTRVRTSCVIAWRWQDLQGPSFEQALRTGLQDAPESALHLAFLGGDERSSTGSAVDRFPTWFVRRLQSWVELDFVTGSVCHVSAPADALDKSTFDSWLTTACQTLAAHTPMPVPSGKKPTQSWTVDLDTEAYAQRMRSIQQHISAGEIEGAVLSVGLSRPTWAHPLDLYCEMARTNPSTFGYCFHGDGVALVGCSPLAFLGYENGFVRLETDAGTRPVTGSAEVDALARAELLTSAKDASEHAVVVDEETQSLAELADKSLQGGCVERLVDREVRAFSHVMHLYTVLAAQLRKGIDLPAALMHLFPPAAVSGRPRRAAMQIGCNAEASPRGPYGGIAGLVRGRDSAQFAVVIRSLWIEDGVARLRVGGKIVKHSTPQDEYAEALNKSRFLVNSVNSAETNP